MWALLPGLREATSLLLGLWLLGRHQSLRLELAPVSRSGSEGVGSAPPPLWLHWSSGFPLSALPQ